MKTSIIIKNIWEKLDELTSSKKHALCELSLQSSPDWYATIYSKDHITFSYIIGSRGLLKGAREEYRVFASPFKSIRTAKASALLEIKTQKLNYERTKNNNHNKGGQSDGDETT